MLIRGAYSSNIKERRDCSAALFDAEGRMVAQAEHIPVHLGAMPEAVAAVIGRDPRPGDVFAVNDPFSGGTHLPDITLVSPMAVDGDVLGYAVTRAHHSDVGGMSPGSMPADSRELFQEGLVIPPVRLVRDGEYVRRRARPDPRQRPHARHPARRPARADRREPAGRAAPRRAGRAARAARTVEAVFSEVIAYTERRTRETLRGLPDGTRDRGERDRGRRRDGRRHPAARDGHARRRHARDRLRRHRGRGRGQRELHDRRDALGVPVRAARAAPRRRARERGRVRAARHPRGGGLARPRAAPVGGRGRATSRRASGSPTPCSPRWPSSSTGCRRRARGR